MSLSTMPDELRDINPTSWVSKYRKNSVGYLLKFAFFYHTLGIGLMLLASGLASVLIPEYEIPSFPVSLVLAAASGPMEESLFFGIPFYLTGNHFVVLVTGSLWSAVHILNTETFEAGNLAYGSLLFSIPHLFFSLRTWISGKGWFAILFHFAWNVVILFSYCLVGLRTCVLFGIGEQFVSDLLVLAVAATTLIMAYLLYKKDQNKKFPIKPLIIAPVIVFVILEIFLIQTNINSIFSSSL